MNIKFGGLSTCQYEVSDRNNTKNFEWGIIRLRDFCYKGMRTEVINKHENIISGLKISIKPLVITLYFIIYSF